MAMRQILTDLADAYARRARQPVAIVSVGGVEAARRVKLGERFDFVVLASDAIDQLASERRTKPGGRTDLARSRVAIAVAAGARRPDISSEAAIRDAVLRARNVGYSTGPSGAHLARLFERWGMTDAIGSRIVQAPPGIPVGTLVARGEVELGFQQLSELKHLPGIDVIGLLPPEIEVVTIFSAAICTASIRDAVTHAWLTFLTSADADVVKRRHGMEPA